MVEEHYVTVRELINDLQAGEGSDVDKFRPDAKVMIAAADRPLDIVSVYNDEDGTVWIDVEEE